MRDITGVGAIRSVDYIILLCEDIDAMRHFYAEVLQFPILEEASGTFVGFQVGGVWLGLRPRGRRYDGLPVSAASASIQLSFRVPPADVDLAYKSIMTHDLDVIEQPTNQNWPHRTLFFRDPENNIIEIFADIHTDDCLAEPSGVHLIAEA